MTASVLAEDPAAALVCLGLFVLVMIVSEVIHDRFTNRSDHRRSIRHF